MFIFFLSGKRLVLLLFLLSFVLSNDSEENDKIEEDDIEESLEKAEDIFKKYQDKQNKAKYLDRYILSAEARHQLPSFSTQNPLKYDAQNIFEIASENLVSKFNINSSEVCKLSKYPLHSEVAERILEKCKDNRPINCSPDRKYRHIDGGCNNLQKPNCGRIFSRLERILDPDYADGVDSPRKGCNGPLPEPRLISLKVHSTENYDYQSDLGTGLLMSFGQFVDHDIEFTTPSRSDDNTSIQCCPDSPDNHRECMPIKIPENDPVFHTRCMNFVRDAPYLSCDLGWRDQMNSLTPALDCSHVYGSTKELAILLRTKDGTGRLKSTYSEIAGELLPLSPNQTTAQCKPQYPAFIGGDHRINQNPVLTCLHTIYLRFHNSIAEELKHLNPCWDDEKIYQEARRIVIACHQKIIYNEYLPLIIGKKLMEELDLDDKKTKYDDKDCPKLWNEFATAAFRLHSTVQNEILMVSETRKTEKVQLGDNFFNTRLIHTGKLDDLIRGAAVQRQDEYDRILSDAVTKYLYRVNVASLGIDLASINIQRGRDHGMRGYISYAEKVYKKKLNSFEDLRGILRENCIEKLKNVYHCVKDIDFFTGLSCEIPCHHALVGCTAAVFIAQQFRNLKYADRYFYTHKKEVGSFKKDQMKTIKKVDLATIICYTTKIQKIKKDPMNIKSDYTDCSKLLPIDLKPWRECSENKF